MVSSIHIDVAELAGVIVESILYGIFVVLFMAAMYLTFLRRRHGNINKIMVLSAIVLAILATIQLAADARNIFLAFVDRTRAERLAFLQDVREPVFILKHTTLILMRLVSDLFVTYRCWIVWNKNIWVVALPIALTLGSGVVGFHTMWSFENTGAETREAQQQWLIALSALSLAANAIATILTAYHIWYTGWRTARVIGTTSSNLTPIVIIVIESSALNAAYMIANTIVLVTGNEGLETMAELGTPLVGCIFMLVIIRVWHNSSQDEGSTRQTSMAFRSGPRRSIESTDGEVQPPAPGKHVVITQNVLVSRDEAFEMAVKEDRKLDAEFAV